ncbi:uncharacterized protein LOC118559873 isoform X2 [Fundulus heteroclitus]|uniref:uncharacterized protein LOC118559873 isoform X2 n=1 Tax=Fundulus heteroclitus TaxID=8078 RepID=UPI00165CA1E9|nr:uncharacterized protein LOC118559873 isoform X2 [Fundulus heteroclitus]
MCSREKSLSVQQLIEGQEMLVLELVLIVVLQFEGNRGGELHLYHRSGDDVVLTCNSPSSSYSCSNVTWFYSTDTRSASLSEVQNGKVDQSSPRAARLNVDSNCSLIINNITAEDAGAYACRFGSGTTFDGIVLLSVLTISPSPPGADPTKDGDFTLQCSLERSRGLGPCPEKSLLWVDETGSELLGEGVGFKSRGQTGCYSDLTVKLQRSSNRTYTCQFVEGNIMKIEAHYPPVFKASTDWSPLSFIMMTLRITALILMVGITVGIIRTRGSKKPQKDINVHDAVDDDPVDYENDEERSAATFC